METGTWERNNFRPDLLATGVGSLPHLDVEQACSLISRTLPETPFWPQLPNRSILESMNLQLSPGLPFLKVDEEKGDVRFDAARDQAAELEKVYQAYLSGDEDSYGIPPRYVGGFEGMIRALGGRQKALKFFKGQMVGPITYGLAVQDGEGKNIIHDDVVFDGIVKGMILRGRWLIQRMKAICPRVIIFLDEPGLSGYGSAFFSVEEETISRRLNEVIEDFQSRGTLVGVHCCGNTDWSLLLKSKADIINFDAWSFFDRFSLYREAIGEFLSRGGILAWGIVPTSEFTGKETRGELQKRLKTGFRELTQTGIPEERIREKSLLTSSCGMGLMSVKKAEQAMQILGDLSEKMREG